MARVYLETSFFSACVSTRTNPKSIVWREASLNWWNDQSAKHELFVSAEVIVELSDARFRHREKALAMVKGLGLLELSPRVYEFAGALVNQKVMPGPAVSGDALHTAAATIHKMEYIVSWNVKHLANPRKREHFLAICTMIGLTPPLIVTPDMLWEIDDDE